MREHWRIHTLALPPLAFQLSKHDAATNLYIQPSALLVSMDRPPHEQLVAKLWQNPSIYRSLWITNSEANDWIFRSPWFASLFYLFNLCSLEL